MTTQIELLKKFKIPIRGQMGQHLLIDPNIQKKIVDLLDLKKNQYVLEIGPGLGAITKEILDRGFRVVAIEKDKRFLDILEKIFFEEIKLKKLILTHRDVLEVDFKSLLKKYSSIDAVVSNLPYYITAPIILKTFEANQFLKQAVFMMQKEVAGRVVAKPGLRDYGRLSLNAYFHGEATLAFHVSPQCFTPKPEVWSSVVHFKLNDRLMGDQKKRNQLEQLVKVAFAQRRKTLLGVLSKASEYSKNREALKVIFNQCGIDLKDRPEQVSAEKFIDLADLLHRDLRS